MRRVRCDLLGIVFFRFVDLSLSLRVRFSSFPSHSIYLSSLLPVNRRRRRRRRHLDYCVKIRWPSSSSPVRIAFRLRRVGQYRRSRNSTFFGQSGTLTDTRKKKKKSDFVVVVVVVGGRLEWRGRAQRRPRIHYRRCKNINMPKCWAVVVVAAASSSGRPSGRRIPSSSSTAVVVADRDHQYHLRV